MQKFQPTAVLIGLLIAITTSGCGTDPTPDDPAFYLVVRNTRGLREGMLEIGRVVELQPSVMIVREPLLPDWEQRHSRRGNEIDGGQFGRWELRGKQQLVGPEGNDYLLQPIPNRPSPLLDSFLARCSRLGWERSKWYSQKIQCASESTWFEHIPPCITEIQIRSIAIDSR